MLLYYPLSIFFTLPPSAFSQQLSIYHPTVTHCLHSIQHTSSSIMGGCASRPKDLDLKEGDAPTEAPSTPKKAEGEAVAQENNNEGGDTESEKKEEPLVDLSEPIEEEKKEETSEPAPAAEAATEAEEPAEKPNEAPVSEDKSDEPLVTL